MRCGLFVGTESFTWTQQQFVTTAETAKTLGIDTLLVKIADGGDFWYGGYSGIRTILQAITATGMHVLPYMFSYGGQFNFLLGEVDIANTVLSWDYDMCMDMESAWNGHTDWAETFVQNIAKAVWISTWADPNEQQWSGVLKALAPKTVYFMPQVYSSFLAGVWKKEYKQAGIPLKQCSPTVGNGQWQAAAGFPNASIWELQSVTPQIIQQVLTSLVKP